jgi:hypothetical protein
VYYGSSECLPQNPCRELQAFPVSAPASWGNRRCLRRHPTADSPGNCASTTTCRGGMTDCRTASAWRPSPRQRSAFQMISYDNSRVANGDCGGTSEIHNFRSKGRFGAPLAQFLRANVKNGIRGRSSRMADPFDPDLTDVHGGKKDAGSCPQRRRRD